MSSIPPPLPREYPERRALASSPHQKRVAGYLRPSVTVLRAVCADLFAAKGPHGVNNKEYSKAPESCTRPPW
ncbi:MAG: hypothetical protein P8J43_00445 [Pirellulales bacterium]|nr:hypothetical protein [Pirellulales bacterium]